MNKLHRG